MESINNLKQNSLLMLKKIKSSENGIMMNYINNNLMN